MVRLTPDQPNQWLWELCISDIQRKMWTSQQLQIDGREQKRRGGFWNTQAILHQLIDNISDKVVAETTEMAIKGEGK